MNRRSNGTIFAVRRVSLIALGWLVLGPGAVFPYALGDEGGGDGAARVIRPTEDIELMPAEPVDVPWIAPGGAGYAKSSDRPAAELDARDPSTPISSEPSPLALTPSTRRFDGSVPREDRSPAASQDDADAKGNAPRPLAPRPHVITPSEERPAPADVPEPTEATDLGDEPAFRWQDPLALKKRLDMLAEDACPAVLDWTRNVRRAVDRLGVVVGTGSAGVEDPATTAALAELYRLLDEAEAVAANLNDLAEAARLRRAAHAVRRRTAVWEKTLHVASPKQPEHEGADPSRVALCIGEIEQLTAGSPLGPAWRQYLLLDALEEWAKQSAEGGGSSASGDAATKRAIEQALARLSEAPLTMAQRQFLQREPLVTLKNELRREAQKPVDPELLLVKLERYEMSHWASEAARVAADQRRLAVSPSLERRRLAHEIEKHYRNANVRIAVREEFIKRLMPDRKPERAPVHDFVRGVPVHGRSTTHTEVGVQMLPDPRRVTLALRIRGQVDSLTTSTSGPATFWNNSQAWYVAEKPLQIDLQGIHLWPAEVRVSNSLRLRDVKTDFDPLPLIGQLANHVARSEHARNRAAANAEIRYKVRRKAKQRIDTEADERLGELSERLQNKLLEPMHQLRLDPVMIDANTSEERFVMRVRLAGEDQLGSHTPRPRAPGNALASFQMHESAINNALARLELAGKTFTLGGLKKHLEERLGRDDLLHIPPDQHDVEITFAPHDPLVVQFQDGKLSISLSIAKLKKDIRAWRDFTVRAFYKPEPDGLSAELNRDGVIHLIGDRLRLGGQIALRGVFARTFSNRRPIRLTPERLVKNPKMEGIEVTQLTVDDGWVGVALGEAPTDPSSTARLIDRLQR